MDQHFSRSSRLLIPADFKNVFDYCEFKVSNRHFLFLAKINKSDKPRLGIVVSKKNVRLAVQRNKIKRIVRQAFRAKSKYLTNIDIIVLARKDAVKISKFLLNQSIENLMADLKRKI
ncbi:ribonuclease P protein component [OM182 bacterium]|jgi:ribonuclease P protein component|nr:ribonuclease P protein component [OM182 bacterium]